ncbi:venom acid phosphatase Acph-1-like [Nasonia vitripennis]|uniref:acid phosphatase n=1 Tax=Nasonia vitripennis TaxID=7425 RepID=A0A7M7LMT2_NASVI|nr:venom acid phosphatase Acph-1-like [Nasonia vitripennis]
MKIALNTILFLVLNHIFISTAQPTDYKLELVQVLFRHGDRTPQGDELYPTDPYRQVFADIGFGQLTKVGMNREHKIGQLLKKRYDSYLGDFQADKVYGYSTDYDRTKMSLQLVLAGVFPPSEKTSWNDDIHWLPIPNHYEPYTSNFLSTNDGCEKFNHLLKDVGNSKEVQAKLAKYKDFLKYVSNQTGIINLDPMAMYRVYNNIRAALSLGLPLPDWCSEEDFAKLLELTIISHDALTHTPLMTRIVVGPTVERLLKNIDNNEMKTDKRKIYLYSAHDVNLASFSNAHKFTGIPRNPDYGTALIVEKLRGRDGQVYLRMLLWTGADERLIPLNVEGCANECPLSYYKSWVAHILPDDEVRECTHIDISKEGA